MKLKRWRWNGTLVAATLGWLGVSGCQHSAAVPRPGLAQRPEAAAANKPEPTPKLTAQQVADIQFAQGRSLEKQGQLAQAAAAYWEALKHDPERADACLRLAILHDREGKSKEARELYQRAIRSMPGNPDIYCNVGYSLSLQQRWAEAEMNLRQALALAPEHARAHNNLGLVLAHQGRCEEALAEFRRAGCTEADACTNLAYALTLEKHWTEARQCYERALTVDPSSLAARKGLQELNVLAGQPTATQVQQVGATVAVPAGQE